MKTIVAVFAHPDDEAFGPSGTLALLSKENSVYLICVTNGDAATGKSDPKLGEIRQKEVKSSARMLGIKEVLFLNYPDGELRNNIYHEVADKIKKIVDKLNPEILITPEPRGISGHIDHVFVSMVTSYVFEKSPQIKEIWYKVIDERERELLKDYYIYFPPGYKMSEINKIMDVSSVMGQKIKAINQHISQKNDVNWILDSLEKLPKEEYFLVNKKIKT